MCADEAPSTGELCRSSRQLSSYVQCLLLFRTIIINNNFNNNYASKCVTQSGCPRAYVCSFVFRLSWVGWVRIWPLSLLNEWRYLMKMITSNHRQVHVTLMTLRSLDQRSEVKVASLWRLYSTHLVNAIAPGRLNNFEHKLTQTFPITGHEWLVFEGRRFKGHGHKTFFGEGIPIDGLPLPSTSIYTVSKKKSNTNVFMVISSTKLGQFWWNLVCTL